MGVQDALSTLLEYNAAMELPYAGLVGIEGILNPRSTSDRSFIENELRAFSEFCQVAAAALGNEQPSAPGNVTMYAAFQRLFKTQGERETYRSLFVEARAVIQRVIGLVPSGSAPEEDEVRQMRDLVGKLQELAEYIKKEIPRDAYLASLTGRPTSPSEPLMR